MKMVTIKITVHTKREAVYTEEQFTEVSRLIQAWADGYFRNVLDAKDTYTTEDNLYNFVNDLELSPGPVADALSKENTSLTITVKASK